MNDVVLTLCGETLFAGIVLFLLPHISPQRIFFAITVPPDFPQRPEGRAILKRYRTGIVLVLLLSITGLVLSSGSGGLAPALGASVPLMAGLAVYLAARAQTKRFAAPSQPVHQVSLDSSHDPLPGWFWIGLLALGLPAAAGAYLNAHWSEIPQRFPVHWSASGQPNRWVEKSAHGVYGPLWAGAGLAVILLLLAAATFYGARRAEMRTVTVKIVIAAVFFTSFIFAGIGLLPLGRISVWLFVVPALVFPLVVIVWTAAFVSKPGVDAENTPDSCWRLGSIYYNPADPALFVQKRIGIGYTFNFANRISWAILAALIAGILGVVFAVR